MPDESDPPRKFFQLKPREFEAVNTISRSPDPAGNAATPPSADSGPSQQDAGRIDVRDLVKQGIAGGPLLNRHAPAPGAQNDVHAMLRDNLARADAAGLNEVGPPRARRSKRKRDYWILMIGVNGLIMLIYSIQIFIGFQVQCLAARAPFEFGRLVWFAITTPQMYVIPGIGIIFFSSALTWLMFHVMEDY